MLCKRTFYGVQVTARHVISFKMFSKFLYYFFYRENGFEPDLDSYSALLVVYGEAGNLEAILKVFII